MRKMLIMGGCGFIGGTIAGKGAAGWSVVVFGRRPHRNLGSIPFRAVDITNRDEVLEAIAETAPDAVVNAAAISNIDFAEKNRELARTVNVLGAGYVAEGSRRINARHVFFSSDAVFDGMADIYREEDPPNPVNVYGKTKAEAEATVLAIHPNSAVIRISLVLGYPVTGGNAFYLSLEERLGRGEEVAFPEDEYRTPVDVLTLAESVFELVQNDFRGIIHIGSTGSVNRFELAREIARAMGYDPDLIRPARAEARPDRAPRHRNGIISVEKARSILKTRMLSVVESVRRSVNDGG